MAIQEIVLCDACTARDIGFGCRVYVGLAEPKPAYDLCARCRAELFGNVVRYLDKEAVGWLRELIDNRRENRGDYDPT